MSLVILVKSEPAMARNYINASNTLPIIRPENISLTHGDIHPGNLLNTETGYFLIDWEEAEIAPPERDLGIMAERWVISVSPLELFENFLQIYKRDCGYVINPNIVIFYCPSSYEVGQISL